MPNVILVVEDEPTIRELLGFTLQRAGFEALEAESAEAALKTLHQTNPNLAIVDWMLPGMSGIDLAYRLRQDRLLSSLPIIMLTAKGEEQDKLRSFESGVDDYVTKPFSPRELIARVNALLRRSGEGERTTISASGIVLDVGEHRININGEPEHFGPTEYRLLAFLMAHPERVFDREQLLNRVWGRSIYVDDRTVDVHVLRIRKILKKHKLDGLIQTVRGVGYRFSVGSDASVNSK
ncbi:MAG: phosphate regulon transcriptional regulatory protein PhoB [Pseudomonadales bacterium]|nr:phosphate regulon transcriptional regulatory protein PhoB [Pseudomonadales bacterium]